jgi:hypothetical protein
MDQIRFARPRRLPVEGKAEDEDDEAGGGGERDGQRRGRAPARQRRATRLHDGEEADRTAQRPHGGEHGVAVWQHVFRRARRVGGGQWLRGSEHVEDMASNHRRIVRHAGDDRAVDVGNQDAAAGAGGPCRQRVRQRFGRARQRRSAVARRAIQRCGKMIGQRLAGANAIENNLAAMFEHLHRGTDADRQHEGDDENRNGAPQHRLGGEKAPVRGVGNRLCHAPDRIRS